MSVSPGLVLRLVSASCVAARNAGQIIRDVMSKGQLGIVGKGDPRLKDLQTEADRSAQKLIVRRLFQQFPEVKVIGEEEQDDLGGIEADSGTKFEMDQGVLSYQLPDTLNLVKEEQVVVWVDPLDGTAEYAQGFVEHVTVLIGIAVDGAAVAGVVHQPFYKDADDKEGRTVWGIVGLGAFGISGISAPAEETIITTTRSHGTGIVSEAVNACQPTSVLRVGGAGNKVLQLIDGKAHAYVFASPGCKKWDTCAPEAVLASMGGTLTDIHGNSLRYHKEVKHPNTGGVLATVKDHDLFLRRIPQTVRDSLPA